MYATVDQSEARRLAKELGVQWARMSIQTFLWSTVSFTRLAAVLGSSQISSPQPSPISLEAFK